MMHHSNSNIGNTSFSTIYQQSMTSFSYYNHVTSNPKTTNIQSTMEKSSYNNGQFHATDAGDPFNSHVNLQTNCLTRKRSSKKDRHSKINTARGPRDRRMRLSIHVAKKFFKLQDMLGFDKASNTVEWLLMKSQHAIRDLQPQQLNQSCSLKGALSSSSSASECEVMSLIDHSLAKKTRAKARARARKRANEKRNIKFGCDGDGEGSDQYANLGPCLDRVVDRTTNRLEPSIPFGVQLTNGAEYPSSHFQFKQGIVDDNSSMMSSNWSPYFLFNYQNTLGPSQENQFSDFEILGKPWDLGINN